MTRTRTRTKTRENTRATPYFNIGRKMKKDLKLDFCAKKTIKKLSIELINSDLNSKYNSFNQISFYLKSAIQLLPGDIFGLL